MLTTFKTKQTNVPTNKVIFIDETYQKGQF